jgi:hypothetical protein
MWKSMDSCFLNKEEFSPPDFYAGILSVISWGKPLRKEEVEQIKLKNFRKSHENGCNFCYTTRVHQRAIANQDELQRLAERVRVLESQMRSL